MFIRLGATDGYKMDVRMTAVMGMGFTGVFYVARYIAPV